MKNKLMKWLVPIFIIFGLILGTANEVNAEGTTVEDIQEKGTLNIGTSADFPPFEFHAIVEGEDQVVGFDIIFAQRIADELGVELNVQDLTFDSLLPALETGTIDAIFAGMTPTEERAESVDFSDNYYETQQNILILDSKKDLYPNSESLQNKPLGAQQGSTQEMHIPNISDEDPLILSTWNDLVIALKSGRIEGIVMQSAIAEAFVSNDSDLYTFDAQLDEGPEGMAVAFQKNSPELVEVTNSVIDEMYAQDLHGEWMAEAGAHLSEIQEAGEDQSFLEQFGGYFWDGVKTTLLITAVSVFFGIVIGTILALLRLSDVSLLQALSQMYVEFVRGTPLMIQIMFIFFAVGYFIEIPALISGIIAVSLNSGAYVAEIIRSGIASVNVGQTEAARSLGLSQGQTMRHVIFPQALRTIWPSLGNEFVTVIKETSIVSVIGVAELTFQSRAVTSISYQGILSLFVTMIIYFIMTFSLTKLLNYLEGKMDYD